MTGSNVICDTIIIIGHPPNVKDGIGLIPPLLLLLLFTPEDGAANDQFPIETTCNQQISSGAKSADPTVRPH